MSTAIIALKIYCCNDWPVNGCHCVQRRMQRCCCAISTNVPQCPSLQSHGSQCSLCPVLCLHSEILTECRVRWTFSMKISNLQAHNRPLCGLVFLLLSGATPAVSNLFWIRVNLKISKAFAACLTSGGPHAFSEHDFKGIIIIILFHELRHARDVILSIKYLYFANYFQCR